MTLSYEQHDSFIEILCYKSQLCHLDFVDNFFHSPIQTADLSQFPNLFVLVTVLIINRGLRNKKCQIYYIIQFLNKIFCFIF